MEQVTQEMVAVEVLEAVEPMAEKVVQVVQATTQDKEVILDLI